MQFRRFTVQALVLIIVGATCLGSSVLADKLDTIKQIDLEPIDSKRSRTVPVRVYMTEQNSPQPVVLFSHGLGGSRDNNAYLGNHWASGGFVCVFMQHAGSDRDVMKSVPLRQRMDALKAAASAKSSRDRCADVAFVIDQLEIWNQETGHPLLGKLDLEHIGMSGHSFGAVTTLAVAGRKFPFRQDFHEPRIDAFLAMSPQPGKGLSPDVVFGEVQHPVLCMTGTKDDSPIDPRTKPESRQEVFKAMPQGNKFQLVFDGGHHFTFGDSRTFRTRNRDPTHHAAIQQISLKFWQAYLKDDASALQWLQSDKPKSDCGLKATDQWQWK